MQGMNAFLKILTRRMFFVVLFSRFKGITKISFMQETGTSFHISPH